MPDLMDFLLYSFYNSNFKADHLGSRKSTARLCNAAIALLEYFRRTARKELTASMHFTPPSAINELAHPEPEARNEQESDELRRSKRERRPAIFKEIYKVYIQRL